MLGDVNIAEPDALIGFAGPRVVRQATGKDLPKGFQHAEFVLEHGFLDLVVSRKDLKDKLYQLMKYMHDD
jgi:acetyl-CoA carboxylase carboxyl transferase subunit beta